MTIREIKPIVDMVKRINEINKANKISVSFDCIEELPSPSIHYCVFTYFAMNVSLESPKIYHCNIAIKYLEDLLEAFGMNTSGEVKDEGR